MNSTISKHTKKESLFGEKLLKIGGIILIILVISAIIPVFFFASNPIEMELYIENLDTTLLPLGLLLLLYGLFYFWVHHHRRRYNQYAKSELPLVIRVKALNNKLYLCASFALITMFSLMILWATYDDFIDRKGGNYFYLLIGIVISVGLMITATEILKDYKDTFYRLEIRKLSVYLFYKEELRHTIELSRVRQVYFFVERNGKYIKTFPRMAIYTSNDIPVICIKLNFYNYHLLKTFFTRKHIKVIDEYTFCL